MRYFLDTEFDGFGGPLISLALVREDGASLYTILSRQAREPWVRENVLPILDAVPAEVGTNFNAVDAYEAGMDIAAFLSGDPAPLIITDWPADIRYFCEVVEQPGGNMAPIRACDFALRRVNAYPTTLPGAVQHNAWWDAMALRHHFGPFA